MDDQGFMATAPLGGYTDPPTFEHAHHGYARGPPPPQPRPEYMYGAPQQMHQPPQQPLPQTHTLDELYATRKSVPQQQQPPQKQKLPLLKPLLTMPNLLH